MSIQVKFRRGTATQHLSFTGANGEITVDTTNQTLRVHDGVTVGGTRIAKYSDLNLSSYLQVANAAATYQSIAIERAALVNTNAYIATKVNTTTFNSALANTNSYIASKLNASTFDSALANTNSYIATKASWSALTSTNTSIRTLISDRLQVANAVATYQTKANELAHLANTNSYISTRASWSALTSTNTAIRGLISDRLQVANAVATYQTKAVERAALANTNQYITTVSNRERTALANTNIYIATKVDTTTFNSALANTNSFIKAQLANTNQSIATVSNRERAALANTNIYIATKLNASSFNSALANTNQFIKNQLANTNSYIATKASWSALTSTNTALRTLISDRLQVANAAAIYQTKATERAALANTNLYIAQKLSVANAVSEYLSKTLNGTASQTVASNVRFSANVAIQGKLVVTGGITTYSANNLVVGDNMIYLNANNTVTNPDMGFAGNYNDGTYHHAGFFRDASDNGTWKVFENYSPEPDANVYINTSHASFRLASFAARNITVANNIVINGNTTIYKLKANGSFGAFNQVLRTNGTTIFWGPAPSGSGGGSTTQYLEVANAVATYQTIAIERAALANTNAYIGNQATRITLVNTNLIGTNTALRTLISDRLQIANAVATYQTKAVERAALANTNAYIASRASWTGLTSTNTALRTLISDRLQVANAVATYQTIAIERAALANTNLRFNLINTNLTGTNTALRTLINDRLQVANSRSYMQVANVKLILANTNSYIATKVDTTTFNLALANTNAYIASVVSGGGGATWSALTSTNTALRTLIDDRLQVANAATLYTTKSNPTTSGLLAHTGRATISTNINVTGNTTITGALINLNNNVTVTTNAGTVSTSYRVSTFTNSSAAAMTITMSTTGAIDGQMTMVRIYDFSAATQTISWVNTENSTVIAPTTSNGSTTLPLTVGFMYNAQTSKWRCIASA